MASTAFTFPPKSCFRGNLGRVKGNWCIGQVSFGMANATFGRQVDVKFAVAVEIGLKNVNLCLTHSRVLWLHREGLAH